MLSRIFKKFKGALSSRVRRKRNIKAIIEEYALPGGPAYRFGVVHARWRVAGFLGDDWMRRHDHALFVGEKYLLEINKRSDKEVSMITCYKRKNDEESFQLGVELSLHPSVLRGEIKVVFVPDSKIRDFLGVG